MINMINSVPGSLFALRTLWRSSSLIAAYRARWHDYTDSHYSFQECFCKYMHIQ